MGSTNGKSFKDMSRAKNDVDDYDDDDKSDGFVQRLLNIYDHSLNKSLIYRSCFSNQKRNDYTF